MKLNIHIDLSKFDEIRNKWDNRHYPKKYKFEYDREFLLDPAIVAKEFGRELTDREYFYHDERGHKKLIHPKVKVSDEIYKKCQENAYILGENTLLSMNSKWCQRNGNMIAFGSAGTGKSRSFIGNNILQANGSMVIHDPHGEHMKNYGSFLEKQGYKIKCLNLKDMSRSNHFNPLAYIQTKEDINAVVSALTRDIEINGDAFWVGGTNCLLHALIGYLVEVEPAENRTLYNLAKLLAKMVVRTEEDEVASLNGLDEMFEDLAKKDENSIAYRNYKMFKVLPAKTTLSIVIGASVSLMRLTDCPAFAELTNTDEMELEKIGKEKTALFIITSSPDTSFNWLASILLNITKQVLYREGRARQDKFDMTNPELEIPVIFMLDEFEILPKLYDLPMTLATCRKYLISVMMVAHEYGQISKIYGKENAESMFTNCDTHLLFVGSYIDTETMRMVYQRSGSKTIRVVPNKQFKHKGSITYNECMSPREMFDVWAAKYREKGGLVICVRGIEPICVKPYNLQNHPNYQHTADANPANCFVF